MKFLMMIFCFFLPVLRSFKCSIVPDDGGAVGTNSDQKVDILPTKKAYDFSVLLAKWKESVPELLESSAKIMTKDLFSWLKESADLSKTPFDDVLAKTYPYLEKQVLQVEDSIDGKTDAV